jgi:hypothetical protein
VGGGTPALIEPAERDVPIPEATRGRYRHPHRELPAVVCLAAFESFTPARDHREVYSYLKVVWFQDDLALPVDPQVEEQLRALDWNGLAIDATD